MQIHVQRYGEPVGPPFSFEEARTYLRDGYLVSEDWAWCEGLTQWLPLQEVIDLLERRLRLLSAPFTLPAPMSPQDLAEFSLQFAVESDQFFPGYLQVLEQEQMAEPELDFGQVWLELLALRIFAVDHALQAHLKSDSHPLLQLFRSGLRRLEIDGCPDFEELISSRALIYGNEVSARHPNGLAANIGEAFAALCGAENSMRLVLMGSTWFNQVYGRMAQWLDQTSASLSASMPADSSVMGENLTITSTATTFSSATVSTTTAPPSADDPES